MELGLPRDRECQDSGVLRLILSLSDTGQKTIGIQVAYHQNPLATSPSSHRYESDGSYCAWCCD